MHSISVVEYQVVNKPSVEFVGINQEIGEVVNKFFLYASVESLNVTVHLWCLGISVVVGKMQLLQSFRKMFLEF